MNVDFKLKQSKHTHTYGKILQTTSIIILFFKCLCELHFFNDLFLFRSNVSFEIPRRSISMKCFFLYIVIFDFFIVLHELFTSC